MFSKTKIICTIGPSVNTYEKILELIDGGMNVARLNFSHGTYKEHQTVIEYLKKARTERNIPLAIMLDTKGPEVRLGKIENDAISVSKGQKLLLVKDEVLGNSKQVSLKPGYILEDLEEGMMLLFDDGYIEGLVVEKNKEGVIVEIKNSGILMSQKGVNIPHGTISLPAMTEQDIEDIAFGCKHDIDFIAASFIRSADHVEEIRRLLHKHNKTDILIISKIENAQGVNNLDSILQVSDGIMVARGDLGVELPVTQVPKLQKMMIKKCYQSAKPVITATQMLESMIHSPRPTRAEVSDIANAVLDGTSGVMLSGETAIGKYPIEAVKMMRSVVIEAEKDINYEAFVDRGLHKNFFDVSSSVALATVKTAYSIRAKAIFACSSSGFTVRAMSRFRPELPIIGITSKAKTYHQLALSWGVVPLLENVKNVNEGFLAATCYSLKGNIVSYGDVVVVTAGAPFGISGTTNTMIVMNIGDVLARGKPGEGATVYAKASVVISVDPKKKYATKGRIIVIPKCDEQYLPLMKDIKGIVLQNYLDDQESENLARKIAEEQKIPLLTLAENACSAIKDGEFITLDPKRGLVIRGDGKSEEKRLAEVCHLQGL